MAFQKIRVTPTLAVTDLEEARRFYGDVVGLEPIDEENVEEGITFAVGDDSFLYVYKRDRPSGSTATSCAFSLGDFDGMIGRLRERGVKFEDYDIPEMNLKTKDGIAEFEDMRAAWFTDPWGNILELDDGFSKYEERLRQRGEGGARTGASAEPTMHA